jgi:hypothetical protein
MLFSSGLRRLLGRHDQSLGRQRHKGWTLAVERLEDRFTPAIQAVSASNPAILNNSVPGTLSSQSVSDDGNLLVYASTQDNVVPNDTNGVSDVFLYNRATGTTTLISVNSAGTHSSNGNSTSPVISGNGQYVAFVSTGTDIAPLATAPIPEVFVRNLATNTTTLVSQNTTGTVEGNSGSASPVISDDGQVIAFLSTATNLDPLATSSFQQVFARNLSTVTTILVSKNTAGTVAGNSTCLSPVISANGQVVTYQTSSNNLDPLDTSPDTDIYARDLVNNITYLVSQSTGGVKGNFLSVNPVISANGQLVAFQSNASNLDPQGTTAGVYVRDLINHTTTLVSQNTAGIGGNGISNNPAISANGQFVAFVSNAINLDPLDTDSFQDVYVRDLVHNTTTLVSKNTAGTIKSNGGSFSPVISASGQYVAFVSTATNLDPIDTDISQDVYVRDMVNNTTVLVSRNNAGTAKNNQPSNTPVLSANAPFVAFLSNATNLVAGEVNGVTAVYGRDFMAQTTVLISRHDPSMPGLTADGASMLGGKSVSDDGRFVVFTSTANNLDPLNTDNIQEVHIRDRLNQTTTLVSQSTAGVRANNTCSSPAISGNGRYVAFVSTATNLDPLDTDSLQDVFVRDLQTGATILVSKNTAGTVKGNQPSLNPVLSDSGQFLVFTSNASNLDPLVTVPGQQVYARDLVNNKLILVSQRADGTAAGNSFSGNPSISASGQFVAFQSNSSNLDPLDTSIVTQVYVRDLVNHTTTLVSQRTDGTAVANGPSINPAISANGQFITFISSASNLDPLDTGFLNQVFVRDLVNHTTTLVSQDTSGAVAGNGSSTVAVPSDTGQFVVFQSSAGNLDPLDTGASQQIFVRDLVNHTTTLVSQNTAGTAAGNGDSINPVVSGDGRFVAFLSSASNLDPLDTDINQDVYLRDQINHTTILVSRNNAGTAKGNSNSSAPAISDNGQVIAFQSNATNLVPGDFNNAADVFAFTQPDLTVAKSHVGNFTQGDIGDTYTITVTNNGPQPTVGPVSVADLLPTALTATGLSGTGWTINLGMLTATRSDPLAPGASYPPLTVTVNVAGNASAMVTNMAVVSGGGELNTSNDTANDPTTVIPQLPNAPVLSGSNDLSTISMDQIHNDGDLVSSLLNGHLTLFRQSGQAGIAITGLNSSNGTWQYSTDDGFHWTTFGAVSDNSATLLGTSVHDRVRFVPDGVDGTNTATLTFRGWDQTDGHHSGDTGVNVSVNGGGTAYSSATATAGIFVMAPSFPPQPLVFGGNLLIAGTNNSDVITVDTTVDPYLATVASIQDKIPASQVSGHLIIYTFGGSDYVLVVGLVSAEIHAGNGNDTITGGAGDDVIFGGGGADVIQGGGGNDVLIGGTGRSRVTAGPGNSLLVGGTFLTGPAHFNSATGGYEAYDYATLHAIAEAWALGQADADLATNLAHSIVHGQPNRLTGGKGHNWFLGQLTGIGADLITNLMAADKETSL